MTDPEYTPYSYYATKNVDGSPRLSVYDDDYAPDAFLLAMAVQAQNDYTKWLVEEPVRKAFLDRLKFEQNKLRVDTAFKAYMKDKRPKHVDNQWGCPDE